MSKACCRYDRSANFSEFDFNSLGREKYQIETAPGSTEHLIKSNSINIAGRVSFQIFDVDVRDSKRRTYAAWGDFPSCQGLILHHSNCD